MSLQLQHITRSFPGVTALDDVGFEVSDGEIHALCGENGAGKSTLVNIVSGNLAPTGGSILINNKAVTISNPIEAQNLGIAVVHQEKSLVDGLSIAENIFAGQQPVNSLGFIDFNRLRKQTKELLDKLQLHHLSPDTIVAQLSSSQKQMVEIAKALSKQPSILILDEPTASITENETQVLFRIVRQLRSEGVSIIYISHRMAEICSIADKVTVLKDGKYQGTKNVGDTNIDELIRMMVGRNIKAIEGGSHVRPDVLLEVKNLSGKGFRHIDLVIRRGEILGLGGLIGSGRTEIAKALFGVTVATAGEILIQDKKVQIRNIQEAVNAGIGYLPEERKTEGIFGNMTIEENIISANMKTATTNGWFSKRKMTAIALEYKNKLRIVASSLQQKLNTLSGGNQQKIVLSRWLLSNPDILIVDEPTHGVDVGAKFEIYQLLQQQAAAGKGILLISSELIELLLLSDTILVVRNGSIVRKMDKKDATEANIMQAACGF
ncbi:MAG TPA: sugar ABC transporter ATP-binding protein [Chitinophagaceae bacterium]|jgi:ABC-type sugar transport system ATPase subunit|nr:sugar ABC transporter ATP-binding protein [Chitinophagaceae bacterium]